MNKILIAGLAASFAVIMAAAATDLYRVTDTLEIDQVPSWFPVGFCLLTHGSEQYAAYYNADHQMVVAKRRLDAKVWQKVPLPTKVGWDSHNYITMTMDAAGRLHLAGNMHAAPLVYFRTRDPGDIATFEKHTMTGQDERRVTYPEFLASDDGTLLFMYRSGGSGNGRRFLNVYNAASRTWKRFIDTALFEGEGKRNAYPLGPVKGPDGLFHLLWVWRDTPDCASNHNLSYARSRDMKHWESADGKPLTLPLTLDQRQAVVDPVPSGGGIINGCEKLAFDAENRPVVSYHKRDDNGHMQIYAARFENSRWIIRTLTDWDKPVPFSGGGAMPFIGISISELQDAGDGLYSIGYHHRDFKSGRITVDMKTLQPVDREVSIPREYPSKLSRPTIGFEGIRVKMAKDKSAREDDKIKYLLRWETLEANHDRPRKPPLPPASRLQLITLRRNG